MHLLRFRLLLVGAATFALSLCPKDLSAQELHLSANTSLSSPQLDLNRSLSQPILNPAELRNEAAASELSIEERRALQAQLKKRRKMVEIHQVFAFASAGTIVAADVVGIINRNALLNGTPTREKLTPSLVLHRVLGSAALSTYLSAGIVAWAMPKPYKAAVAAKGKKKANSGDAHVALSVVHGIAMGTVIATGIIQANAATGPAWDALLGVHAAAGLTAASAIIGAGIVIGTL